MNKERIEFMLNNNLKKAQDMPLQELSNWLALCNALKFINDKSRKCGVYVDEKDINYRELNNYIVSTSGDIATCLRETGGVPFKFSLSLENEESLDTNDLTFEFLEQ